MKYYILVLFLSLTITNSEAQTTVIDSLQEVIKSHTAKGKHINRLEAITRLGQVYFEEKKFEKGIEILKVEIEDFNKQIPDTTKGKAILQ